MRRKYYLLSGALLIGMIFTSPIIAHAQEEEGTSESSPRRSSDDEAGVIYRKKTIVSFDEDTIDGDLTRPDGEYIESRKRVRHSNLIRIRENFREKILYSASGL